jgi:hypothetical protein
MLVVGWLSLLHRGWCHKYRTSSSAKQGFGIAGDIKVDPDRDHDPMSRSQCLSLPPAQSAA